MPLLKKIYRGVRVVKSFVREKDQFDKFTQVSDELLGENLYIGYAFSVMQPAMMFDFLRGCFLFNLACSRYGKVRSISRWFPLLPL